ncbi:MAG: hypothetical protein JNG89_11280 [Planctomycetaceae bacterium]|nr:hypothetical protein [Planctomycetaceae bacterium]
MKPHMRHACLLVVLLATTATVIAADEYTFEPSDAPPSDVPAAIADLLDPQGAKVVGPKRDLCEVWLLKDVARIGDFAPSTSVKYPFTPGQLVGVLKVPRRAGFSDFRGHEIGAGVYTLRYGQQPMDGNHIGTSDTADFLLAVPVADDADPAPIADLKSLFTHSAEASGTVHPAIFPLLPAEDAAEPGLSNDAEHELWILQVTAKSGDAALPLRIVLVGIAKG